MIFLFGQNVRSSVVSAFRQNYRSAAAAKLHAIKIRGFARRQNRANLRIERYYQMM